MNKVRFGIETVIDNYITEKRLKKIRDNSKWHGSDMGLCLRKRFYKRKGLIGEELDSRTLRVFECGDIFHKWLQDILNRKGLLVAAEEEISDNELNYLGHYDALVKVGDSYILYDFKTVNSQAFTYFDKEGFPEHHVCQLMSYIYFLRKQRLPGLEEGRILYISKDDLRTKEIKHLYTAQWETRVISELQELNNYWQRKEIPPRIVKDYKGIEKNAWQCAKKIGKPRKDGTYRYKPFCPYFEHCWKEKNTTIEVNVY